MKQTADSSRGRFAPTPSGPLHFGSLVTAVASYCNARAAQGKWLLRIEDLDTPRVVAGAADNILFTLESYGFEWDGEVLYQSQRFDYYEEILQQLIKQGLIYGCECSRKKLLSSEHKLGPLGLIYPQNCRSKQLDLRSNSLRLKLDSTGLVEFSDQHHGNCQLNLKEQVGDITIKRRDGIYAYHLAVVLDDAYQEVNSIVRGTDLLYASCIHLYLNQLLGFESADYMHIPLVNNQRGEKLSKQTGAEAIQVDSAANQLVQALKFLGQDLPVELLYAKPAEILSYACQHWDDTLIPETIS